MKKLLAPYNGKLKLDDELFAKSNAAITKELKGNTHLTRQELEKIWLVSASRQMSSV
jgi:hypothetical protein